VRTPRVPLPIRTPVAAGATPARRHGHGWGACPLLPCASAPPPDLAPACRPPVRWPRPHDHTRSRSRDSVPHAVCHNFCSIKYCGRHSCTPPGRTRGPNAYPSRSAPPDLGSHPQRLWLPSATVPPRGTTHRKCYIDLFILFEYPNERHHGLPPGSGETRSLTGVPTHIGDSPSSSRCSARLITILYYINHLM